MESVKKKGVYRRWSMEEKRAAVARMESVTRGALAAELGVPVRLLRRWREQMRLLEQKAKREGAVGAPWSGRTAT